MEGFPSGQRGQTVNLLLSASMVRIHLPPPNSCKAARQKARFAGLFILSSPRDIAQLGSALRSGRRGRRFKSCYPDHVEAKLSLLRLFLCKKVIRPLPCFSFFTKSHARLTCSVVNALTTVRCR